MKTLFCLLFLSAPQLRAEIVTAASCSQADFETAYYHSKPGDTVVLPAGEGVWGAGGNDPNQHTIYLSGNYALDVRGQGDSTVITLANNGPTYVNGVIWIGGPVTFSGVKIIGAGDNTAVTAFQISPYANFTGGFRITHVTYEASSTSSYGYFCYCGAGVKSGLIDHCTISCAGGATELIFGRGPTDAWQSENTLGGADNIFIEDCTFGGAGYVCDANSNARFVLRYNTINGTNKIDGHGMASNSPPRSVRNVEVYGNHFTNASIGTAIEIRGGTGMIFDNVSDGGAQSYLILTDYGKAAIWPNYGLGPIQLSSGNPTTITTPSPHGFGTGWNVLVSVSSSVTEPQIITVTGPTTFTIDKSTTVSDEGTFGAVGVYQTPYNYPLIDQIGVGKDPRTAHSEPAYVWHNLKNGSAWPRSFWLVPEGAVNLYRVQIGDAGATFTEADIVKSNRDFFADSGFDDNTGVTVGTAAQMAALTPSVTGYGFWVTDEGSWNTLIAPNTSGRLYRWNGSAWALYYTPYTYPNPLQGSVAVVATPSASPIAGTYDGTQSVTLTCATSGADIYYTTNGSTPDSGSTLYTTAISVAATTTIRAIGIKSGLDDSPVQPFLYSINTVVATPTASPVAATYSTPQSVTLTCSTSGAAIHYTTDGSIPTSGSTLYVDGFPISVSATTTIKTIGIKSGLDDSIPGSFAYTITASGPVHSNNGLKHGPMLRSF